MLHVLNGDATLALLKESSVKGPFLVWKDMLMEGPVGSVGAGMQGLDWKARAAFLNREYGIDSRKYLAGMKSFFRSLDKAAQGAEEVVFWFEEDFFCQIHLAYLLAHLPAALKAKGRASIICPEKPLGVRLPGAFPKLLAGRLPLRKSLLTLASKVWKAYAASSPKGWEDFLNWARSGDHFAIWPMLKGGLRAHLGRLPTPDGRANALETALLRSAASGSTAFPQYVRHVWSEPAVRPLGLGDMQVACYALDLARRAEPLLAITGPDSSPKPGKPLRFSDWKLHLTPEGKARLAEAADVRGKKAGSGTRARRSGAKTAVTAAKPAPRRRAAKAKAP